MTISLPPRESDHAKAAWNLELTREINRLQNQVNENEVAAATVTPFLILGNTEVQVVETDKPTVAQFIAQFSQRGRIAPNLTNNQIRIVETGLYSVTFLGSGDDNVHTIGVSLDVNGVRPGGYPFIDVSARSMVYSTVIPLSDGDRLRMLVNVEALGGLSQAVINANTYLTVYRIGS